MASKIIVDQVQKSGGTAFTLPTSDGSVNQLMKTDGSGNLGFVSSAVGGKVLQLLEHNLSSVISSTSTSYVASGLTITVTPASTASKFLLTLAGGEGYNTASGDYLYITFYVDGSEVSDTGPYERSRWSGDDRSPHSALCLHSPSTTSATTYTVYYKVGTGTGYFNSTSGIRVEFTVMELSS